MPWVRFLFVSQLFYRSIVCVSYSEPNEEEYMDLFMKIRWIIWKLEAKWTRSAWQCTFNEIRDCWLLNRFRWNTYIFLPSRENKWKINMRILRTNSIFIYIFGYYFDLFIHYYESRPLRNASSLVLFIIIVPIWWQLPRRNFYHLMVWNRTFFFLSKSMRHGPWQLFILINKNY